MFTPSVRVHCTLFSFLLILSFAFLLAPLAVYGQDTCPRGQVRCGADCVDLKSDARNCGECGAACPTPPHAEAACFGGRCSLTCFSGWGDCDQNIWNGCETNLATDTRNCGACGTICPGRQMCTGGMCR